MLDIQDGLTILVDKPYTWTSFDVVNKIRGNLKRSLGLKNVKVGHAGTLDPLATGLLVLCLGKHTKLIEGLTSDGKTYTGTFLLGKTTPSFDLVLTANFSSSTTLDIISNVACGANFCMCDFKFKLTGINTEALFKAFLHNFMAAGG